MPGYDATGPMVRGAGTGGGRGFCEPGAGSKVKDALGRGRAWGSGRKGQNDFADCREQRKSYGTRPEKEITDLKHRAVQIEKELEILREMISRIETEN